MVQYKTTTIKDPFYGLEYTLLWKKDGDKNPELLKVCDNEAHAFDMIQYYKGIA